MRGHLSNHEIGNQVISKQDGASHDEWMNSLFCSTFQLLRTKNTIEGKLHVLGQHIGFSAVMKALSHVRSKMQNASLGSADDQVLRECLRFCAFNSNVVFWDTQIYPLFLRSCKRKWSECNRVKESGVIDSAVWQLCVKITLWAWLQQNC